MAIIRVENTATYEELLQKMEERTGEDMTPKEAAWMIVRELTPKRESLVGLYQSAHQSSKEEAKHALPDMQMKVAVLSELMRRHKAASSL